VKRFQQWGAIVSEVANKVPSRIAYSSRTGQIKGFGFNCDFEDPNCEIQEFFKLYLDPEYQDDYEGVSNAEAQRYYRDYLLLIHAHIVRFFHDRFPDFRSQSVEWIFSVPTTWRNPALIHSLELLIREAGFGTDGAHHTAKITLTEAEAAAVNVVAGYVQRDDVVCICDAGGGTTDVNILKLRSGKNQPIKLTPLSKVEGAAIGSALIDLRVQQYLEQRLNECAHRLPASPAEVAEKMMQGRFERFKCTFGTSAANLPALVLEVPGLPAGTNIPRAGIQNSRISISQYFLRELFDEQVQAMISLLRNQIVSLQASAPGERVAYLVLSGGLGSSQYVRDQIKHYFQFGPGATLSNTSNMHMLLAEDPQLAVVLGLVMDRAQELGQYTKAITERCARVSYGVVVNHRYDPQRHQGQMIYKDPRDKKAWALNQIEWLIREVRPTLQQWHKKLTNSQGDNIGQEGVSKHVRAKLQKTQLQKPWRAQFVISTERRENLPQGLSSVTVKTLCIVEADLRFIDRVTKNGHWWQLGHRYELAEFDLKLIPGSADLKFQLWNNGRLITGENESVAVDWGAGRPVMEQIQDFEIR